MKKLNSYLLIFILHCCMHAHGQHISDAMLFTNPVNPKDSNSISLAYSNLFYIRDYEYFLNIQTGYTLFGTWHYPRIAVQPNKWLKLEAGALLQKDFGDNALSRASPMFSLQVGQKKIRVIFGALEGSQTHQLTEPLLSFDKVIERPIEEGLQVKLDIKRITTDLWLDWEHRQKEDSNFPEQLTGGLSVVFNLSKPDNAWEIKIPVEFIMPHKGGQLDTNTSIVVTVFDKSVGASVAWKNPFKKEWLQQIKGDLHYIDYKFFEPELLYPYRIGNGILINFFLLSKWNFSFQSTYWKGHHYIAPNGGKLFQSISSIPGSNYTEPDRQLLFLTMAYEKELYPGFFIDARYSPYIDLPHPRLEHAMLLLFSYRNIFWLSRLKKQR